MAPADLGRILFGSVLRVVDQKVGVIDELGVSQILPNDLPIASCQCPRVWFVITSIHHRHPIRFEPITERERWMIQIFGAYFYIVDFENTLDEVVIADRGSALIERNREISVLHLPGQGLMQ